MAPSFFNTGGFLGCAVLQRFAGTTHRSIWDRSVRGFNGDSCFFCLYSLHSHHKSFFLETTIDGASTHAAPRTTQREILETKALGSGKLNIPRSFSRLWEYLLPPLMSGSTHSYTLIFSRTRTTTALNFTSCSKLQNLESLTSITN